MGIIEKIRLDRKEELEEIIKPYMRFRKWALIIITPIAALISFWIGISGLHWSNLLVSVVLTVVFVIIRRNFKGGLFQKAESLLMENCDSQLYFLIIDEMERLGTSRFTRDMLFFSKVNALSSLGLFAEGNEVLGMINAKAMEQIEGFSFKLWYYSQKFFYYASIADKEHMRLIHYKTKELKPKIQNKDKIIFDSMLVFMEAAISVAEGDFVKGTQILLNLPNGNLDDKGISIVKVFIQYFLGYVDVNVGDVEIARERLQYVINEGNTLYVVDKAKKLMLEYGLSNVGEGSIC